MTSGSGQPGGDAPTLIIRGIGSINADNDPLIIVDGMPYEEDGTISTHLMLNQCPF